MENNNAETVRSFEIRASKRAMVETELARLAARAAKKGLPELVWSFGRPYTSVEPVQYLDGEEPRCSADVIRIVGEASVVARRMVGGEPVAVCQVTAEVARIRLELPVLLKYAGWHLVAIISHLPGDAGGLVNIVAALPGETLLEASRERGPVCDHCHSRRQRNTTFVLRHDDGRNITVGKTCLGDFLGDEDAATKMALQATILAELQQILAGAREMDEGFGGMFAGSSSEIALAVFLARTAYFVRARGWMSRTKADETGAVATVDYVRESFVRGAAAVELTEVDRALAQSAMDWAAELTALENDYTYNIHAVACSGLVHSRTQGLAASIVGAYLREQETARKDASKGPMHGEFVGAPKAKLVFESTLEGVAGYETQYGYTTVLRFRIDRGDMAGALVIWKTGSTSLTKCDAGKRFAVKGTVKGHDTYRDEKQTTILRATTTELVG